MNYDELEDKVQELEKKLVNYDELEDKVRSLCEYITYIQTETNIPHIGEHIGKPVSPKGEPLCPVKYNIMDKISIKRRKLTWDEVLKDKGWNI